MKRGTASWLVFLAVGIGLLVGGAAALLLPEIEIPATSSDQAGVLPEPGSVTSNDGNPAVGDSPIDALATQAAIRRAERPQVGKPAKNFELSTLAGGTLDLADTLGKPVLINFWATWCPPCRNEIPLLNTAAKEWAADGLVVLGLNMTHIDDQGLVSEFVADFPVEYPVLLDLDGRVANALYQVENLPVTFFVDREGIIQWIQVGEMSAETLKQALGKIIP